MNTLRVAVALLAPLLLAACRQASSPPAADILFHRFVHVDATGWMRDDTLLIALPEVDSLTRTEAVLQVRAGQDYPLTTLRLCLLIDDAGGSQRRLVDIPLYPATDSGAASLRESPSGVEQEVSLGEIVLKSGRTATLRVCHAMRQQSVPGVRSIGLRLTAAP